MRKLSFNPKLATLGFVGVIVSLAVLAVNQAQEESYITDAAEAASCANVCNTFVPPQTEDECEELMRTRFYEEYWRNSNALGRLASSEEKELEASHDIYHEEWVALKAVLDERVGLAKAAYVVKATGLTAAFYACLAKSAGTGPLSPGAFLLCSGLYTAGMAAAWQALRVEVADANSDAAAERRIAREDWDDRDGATIALYDKREANEDAAHRSQLALIDKDFGLCLERVNG